MNDLNPGLALLLNQSKTPTDALTSNRCAKIKTLLDGIEYYVPASKIENIQPLPTPPFPIHVPNAYSEIMAKSETHGFERVGVKRHSEFTILGTGCTVEMVDLPPWWAKRDSNGI